MRRAKPNPYVLMHGSIMLFGLTAILGDLIQLSAFWLVWWRLLLAGVGFWAMLIVFLPSGKRFLSKRRVPQMVAVGTVVGLHWVFFFGSIALSSITIAVVMLATAPFMAALIEPLARRTRLRLPDLMLGAVALAGIWLIYNAALDAWLGMVAGLLSAATSAYYGILNKDIVRRTNPLQINFYQMAGAWLIISVAAPLYLLWRPADAFRLPSVSDFQYLAVLAFVCTNLAYVMSLTALRRVAVFTYILAVNLEPIYSILLAWAVFGEQQVLDWQFFLGTVLVIGSVFVSPALDRLSGR